MQQQTPQEFIEQILNNMPSGWLRTTTHRLDIYDESLAKTQFLEQFEALYKEGVASTTALETLPTAYDYIRLGHPLSCVLEWGMAKELNLDAAHVISFQSQTVPVLAVLRKNLLDGKQTQILYTQELPDCFNAEIIKEVYGYTFELKKIASVSGISAAAADYVGRTIFISEEKSVKKVDVPTSVDFHISLLGVLGSILTMRSKDAQGYVSAIQHVRRRETIAMTPANSLTALQSFIDRSVLKISEGNIQQDKKSVLSAIKKITQGHTEALVASSGLSMQYAIMMGLVHNAQQQHPGKAITFIVPPNCYGGTNDQARRVAACLEHVEVVDLPVDGDNDMVQSIDRVLDTIAQRDAVPYIIAEIPTNPRVEVPNLEALKKALSTSRKTSEGNTAIPPVFILDQTFCPNVNFLGEDSILANVQTISYVSGSKFPSGGRCTAGYCVANKKASALVPNINTHLKLCDNEATGLQLEILAEQLPSMNERIARAYNNTREFVNFIEEELPEAKINFVSEALAEQGFTPSVFSLDLPTRGTTLEERELYKRALNHKLIHLMITEIPTESKYCVSYGQLKGCYWTIPATSTQGTTKEGDKDYIARVSLSANMDLERHKEVFREFLKSI